MELAIRALRDKIDVKGAEEKLCNFSSVFTLTHWSTVKGGMWRLNYKANTKSDVFCFACTVPHNASSAPN